MSSLTTKNYQFGNAQTHDCSSLQKPHNSAVTYNSIRQDITCNICGIIQISQEFVIESKKSILTPNWYDTRSVLANFFKAVRPILNPSLSATHSVKYVQKMSDNLVANEHAAESALDHLEADSPSLFCNDCTHQHGGICSSKNDGISVII